MLIKRHPQQGARVVSALDGYGPVAEIILAHHERIDGKGYPRGLAGDEIPELSRIISVSDTYDVMTARDSYRTPMSSSRRDQSSSAGSPANSSTPSFVEIFIELLEGEDVSFQHGEAADFEKELALESRIAETASPGGESSRFQVARRPALLERVRLRPDAGGHFPGAGRGAGRGAARAGARAPRRGDHPGRGERRLRLRPPHLPWPGPGRAGLHDRPRVRRHGAGGRRRSRPGSPSATACSAASTSPAAPAPPACAATTTAASGGGPSATARHLGALHGTQADQAADPLRRHDPAQGAGGDVGETALFAGDVMGTGYHAVAHAGMTRRRHGRRARPRPGRPLRGAGGGGRRRRPRLRGRLGRAAARAGRAVRRDPGPPHRGATRKPGCAAATGGRGADVVVDAVGAPAPLVDAAISLARNAGTVSGIGVQAGRGEVPLGLAWLKGLDLRLGLANVIAHVDRVLGLLEAGKLDPTPLVTHHMKLDAGGRGLRPLRPARGAEDRPHALSLS